jgi:5-methyltetrahydropteroyltriglutamate--homocysteine methyltransferase
LNEAEEWASRLGIVNYHDLAKDLLKSSPDRQRKLLQLSTLYGLRLFEKAGLDNDGVGGEQQRVEMYEHVIKNVAGMRFLGHVNSFDYKYFRKAVAEGAVDRGQPIYVQEFRDVQKLAHRPVKVPITGPYTLVDWSYNEHYQS